MREVDKTISEAATASAAGVDSEAITWLTSLARQAFMRALSQVQTGRLLLVDPLGSEVFGRDGDRAAPDAEVHVSDPSLYLDVATGGALGAGDAFIKGKWTSPDPAAVIRLLILNRHVLFEFEGNWARIGKQLLRLGQWLRRNTKRQSRRNIAAHYDLGNELFELFLDPTMMYSAAVYPRADSGLEEAAVHKLDLICRKLELTEADHLLEIGTGWGGLAIHAAREFGCQVTTTTISSEQHRHACDRVRAAGLEDRVTVLARDYRDLDGQYDKLVSVEMIEAVGTSFFDTYFRVCSERLKPHGRMLLQGIVMVDRHYQHYVRTSDFIKKYIFPGGSLPSLAVILDSIARVTDLQMVGLHDIGVDYARTLREWCRRFMLRLDDVRRLGYPEEFIRMWQYYLCYCEAGFTERAISDVQLVFDKPACRLPASIQN